MAQVDAKLVTALKQARTNSMAFVFVAKGNEGKLLVDKKKISAKDADEAKKACGGGTMVRGRCKSEEGVMVFEVGKEVAPTLAGLTKKIIKQDAGLTLEVEYRVAADLAGEDGAEGSPVQGANQPATAPVAPSQAPPPAGAAEVKRLNAMAADIKAALLGPHKARVQSLFVTVNGQIKAKDFAAADKSLDDLAALCGGAVAQADPGKDASPAAAWERRVLALEPRILEAQKTRASEGHWMTLFMSAQDLGAKGEFAKSTVILDKLEGLLNAAPAGHSAELSAVVRVWETARADAVKHLQAELAEVAADLQEAAADKAAGGPADDERFDIVAAAAELELRAVVKRLGGTLATKAQAAEMRSYLDTDEVVADVCELTFDFRASLKGAIDAIIGRLPA